MQLKFPTSSSFNLAARYRLDALYLVISMSMLFQTEDLVALLRDEEDAEDMLIQTDISDQDLEKLLDRSDLIVGPKDEDGNPTFAVDTLPLKGPGWEVVIPTATGGMLSTLNS